MRRRAAAQGAEGEAEQQVITVGQVAEAERDKQVAMSPRRRVSQERIGAEVEA